MMNASGLRAQYANETSLTGLLYVVNIDSKEEAVTLEEIAEHL
jgi:predicted GIY-YIG superfamily endonuclease